MSGEFGAYHGGGYFHDLVRQAHEDLVCERSSHPMVPMLRDLFGALVPIARQLSWYEAADSGADAPVMALLEEIATLRKAVRDLERFAEPYARVAAAAVEKALAEDGAS